MKGKLIPFDRRRAERSSDEGLVYACATGDTDALATLFDKHAPSIRRFLSRCADRPDADVDDLVHATFLEAFRGAGGFRGRSAERTWLLGIALNVLRHRQRSEGRRRIFQRLWLTRDRIAPSQPDVLVAGRRILVRIDAALAALPQSQREAFLLCEVEELSGREAAQIMGIPAGTLGRHLHEARQALRSRLWDEEV